MASEHPTFTSSMSSDCFVPDTLCGLQPALEIVGESLEAEMQPLDGALLHVQDVVDRQPIRPRFQPAPEAELRQVRDDADQDLLGRVLRVFTVPQHPQRQSVDVLAGTGTGARLEYRDIDPSFLTLERTAVSDQPVVMERDQTKRHNLHLVAGSEAARIGAGLFTKQRGTATGTPAPSRRRVRPGRSRPNGRRPTAGRSRRPCRRSAATWPG